MLIDLTPNTEEAIRKELIAKQHNFEYIPQYDERLKLDKGIYRENMDFNFSKDDFIECKEIK